jgi:hypothetical protein
MASFSPNSRLPSQISHSSPPLSPLVSVCELFCCWQFFLMIIAHRDYRLCFNNPHPSPFFCFIFSDQVIQSLITSLSEDVLALVSVLKAIPTAVAKYAIKIYDIRNLCATGPFAMSLTTLMAQVEQVRIFRNLKDYFIYWSLFFLDLCQFSTSICTLITSEGALPADDVLAYRSMSTDAVSCDAFDRVSNVPVEGSVINREDVSNLIEVWLLFLFFFFLFPFFSSTQDTFSSVGVALQPVHQACMRTCVNYHKSQQVRRSNFPC